MQKKFPWLLFTLILLLLFAPGCAKKKKDAQSIRAALPPLIRVGVVADTPPLAYKDKKRLYGLEVQLANGLAKFTQKTIKFYDIQRQDIASALESNKVDIIVAGLTVEGVKALKFSPSNRYLLSGQIPLAYLNELKQVADKPESLTAASLRLGTVNGTKGQSLVNALPIKGKHRGFSNIEEGVKALLNKQIDVLVHDMPSIFYAASTHIDKGLSPGATPFSREELAWALRREDKILLEGVNAYFSEIEKNGQLNRMVQQTIPFYQETPYMPPPAQQ